MTTLVWFRNDLRTRDNPALHRAIEREQGVHACFAVSLSQWRSHDVGEARLAFLWRQVKTLQTALADAGIPLTILDAPTFDQAPDAITSLAGEVGANAVVFNNEYPLNEKRRDSAVVEALERHGISVERFDGSLTLPPGSVLTATDAPYSVFSPFRKRWLSRIDPTHVQPLPAPDAIAEALEPAPLDPWPNVAGDYLADLWPAGEDEAQRRLRNFLDEAAGDYAEQRDIPAVAGTSTLSPYLSVGAISPNQCLAAAASANNGRLAGGVLEAWINEIIWREFYRHVIALFPHVSQGRDFRSGAAPRWRDAPDELEAWQQGLTGYPLVDAAQRQLLKTGWMHNRLRMVSAMFLTKHLLIDWREGERHFMQHLVDGDFASNNGGWQWSASTGTDAAPYFRIFNPAAQGKKFDPRGAFTRAMIPQLTDVPDRHLYEPHSAGIDIDYPAPIVEHRHGRERALEAFKAL